MDLNKRITGLILKHNRILINIIIPAVFVVIFMMISFTSIANKSDTVDEKFHLTRGILLIKTGDLRINQHHPYLFNLIEAIPAVSNPELELPDIETGYWENADKDNLSFKLVEANGGNEKFSQVILYGPRVFAMFSVTVLILITYFLVLRLFGPVAGIVTLAFLTTDPNLIAHTRLVTTDAPSALIIFIVALLYFKLLKQNKSGNYTIKELAIIIFASFIALMSKYSAVFIILPLILLLGVSTYFRFSKKGETLKLKLWMSVKPVLIAVFSIFILLTAAYMFQFSTMEDMAYGNEKKIEANLDSFKTYGDKWTPLERMSKYVYFNVPFPFPQYVNGFYENVFKHNFFGHSSFFMGEFSSNGWLLYFPVAFLLKEPVGTLLFVIGSIILGGVYFWKKKPKIHSYHFALLIPPIIIGSLSLISSINLGIRHILPIFPFIFLFGGILIDKVLNKSNFIQIVAPILVLLLINYYALFTAFPNYISYFNQLAGGSPNGYNYLRDSNFDWNQDYLFVLDYIEENPDMKITIVPEITFGYDHLIISKEDLYGNPEKRNEFVEILNGEIERGEAKIIDEVSDTHVVVRLFKGGEVEE